MKIRGDGKKSEQGVIESPISQKRICHIFDNIDELDKEAIWKEVLAFYERGELPTLNFLLEKVSLEPIAYQGGRTTLLKILKDLGFIYKKHSCNRPLLILRNDIVAARNKYLWEIKITELVKIQGQKFSLTKLGLMRM